jgi:SAM-dependent methyltransferase
VDGTEQPVEGVDELVGRLRQMVAARREAGRYPKDLEAELERRDLNPATAIEMEPDLTPIRQTLDVLRHRSFLDPARITTDSRVPGGALVHRAAGRAVARQTQGIMQQVQEFAQQAVLVVESMQAVLETHMTRVHDRLGEHLADVGQRLDAIHDRMARFERQSLGPDADLIHLRRRVEELEAAEARRGFQPWFSNERFEERFRGSREELLDRYRDLAEQLRGCGPVLDIGFGRGEMLELLAEFSIPATGVEIDPVLVKAGQERSLDVALGDAIGTLTSFDDGALGGIVLIQVVEHLPAQELLELVVLAVDKLRPTGRLIMETVNPQTLSVFANSFYLDPTHGKPIHPSYLEFLCREAGFTDVRLEWRSFPAEANRLAQIDNVSDLNRNIEKLNLLLFGAGDYAVVATR